MAGGQVSATIASMLEALGMGYFLTKQSVDPTPIPQSSNFGGLAECCAKLVAGGPDGICPPALCLTCWDFHALKVLLARWNAVPATGSQDVC